MNLYFLLNNQSFLNLLFVFFFNQFGFCFLFFLKLLKILDVLPKNLITFLQSSLSFISLVLQVFYLFFNNSMCHCYQKHLFFLLKNIDNGLIFCNQIFVLLSHLYNFKCTFDKFFLFVVKRIHRHIFIINRCFVFIKSFQRISTRSCCFIPNSLLICS